MKSNKNTSNLKAQLTTIPGLKYFNEVDTELRKVTWPSRQQVIRMSAIVIIVSVAIGAFLGALDLGFTSLVSYVVTLTNSN